MSNFKNASLGLLITTVFGGFAHADSMAFTNARLPTVLGDDGGRGTLLVEDGVIAGVGSDVAIPADARVIDVKGDVITPGLIVSNTSLGVIEISGGADANESGTRSTRVSAGVDVQYALNPASTLIPIARRGGVTRAIVTPSVEPVAGRESFYAGQAAMIHTAASRSILSRQRVGVVANLSVGKIGRAAAFAQLRAELDDARAYARRPSALERDQLRSREWTALDLEALGRVVEGRVPLVVTAHRASDIRQWLRLAEEEKISLILVGVAEGWQVAEELASADVPVVLNASDSLPNNFDRLGSSLKNAATLNEAGVRIAIMPGRAGHDARHLRYFAGLAVAHGVPYEDALDAVTVNVARIWGEDSVGALAAGQKADLSIWSDDPFEPLTSLKAIYIDGERQSLETRQTQLADKYLDQ